MYISNALVAKYTCINTEIQYACLRPGLRASDGRLHIESRIITRDVYIFGGGVSCCVFEEILDQAFPGIDISWNITRRFQSDVTRLKQEPGEGLTTWVGPAN